MDNSKQLIIVTVESEDSVKAIIESYEKINNNWHKVYGPIAGVVGQNGVNKEKEGDNKSPTGVFTFGTGFGTSKKPSALKIAYKQADENDYWVDDLASPDYNKWVRYEGNPNEKWNSFERLSIPEYKYALVINYNTLDIESGKGSAIFMHIWNNPDKGTAGCTAMAESNMLEILTWLDLEKNPILIQGPKSWVEAFIKQNI